jgi:hypothetical protein
MLKPLTDHGIADQEGSSMGIGETKNGESLSALRRMIFEQVEYSDLQRQCVLSLVCQRLIYTHCGDQVNISRSTARWLASGPRALSLSWPGSVW